MSTQTQPVMSATPSTTPTTVTSGLLHQRCEVFLQIYHCIAFVHVQVDGEPVSCVHVLNCVSKHALKLPLSPLDASNSKRPSTQNTQSDVSPLLCDRRIVRATGPWVHSDILGKVVSLLCEPIQGRHITTFHSIQSTSCCSIAVNPSETMMVIACCAKSINGDKLYLHELPSGRLVSVCGSWGLGEDGETYTLSKPQQVCFGPDDTILVADWGNNRLHVYEKGKKCVFAPVYHTSIHINHPYTVDVSHTGDMIVVGTATSDGTGTIAIFDYEHCDVLEFIDDDSVIVGYVTCVRFTPDDETVLALASNSESVMEFSVADGSVLRSFTHGCAKYSVSGCVHGLTVTPYGDIIMVDNNSHRVLVFNEDGSVLSRVWGRQGKNDGEFNFPAAVAFRNGRLYVLDEGSLRVQVFE